MAKTLILTNKKYKSDNTDYLHKLLDDKDLSDVTLATGDGKQIRSHRIVLCSVSKFLRDIFLRDPHQAIVIYLKGVAHDDLQRILTYIYKGECEVEYENLEAFLELGKELQIKGISDLSMSNNIKENIISPEEKSNAHTKAAIENQICLNKKNVKLDQYKKSEYEKSTIEDISFVNSTDQVIVRKGNKYIKARCNIDDCNVVLCSKNSLKLHQTSQHNIGEKFQCDQCDYQTAYKDALNIHVGTVHENVRYQCEQCDYRATQKSALNIHIRAQHEGVKFTCDMCGKLFRQYSSLIKHIEYKHGERKFKCDECDYLAGQPQHLTSHLLSKHNVTRSLSEVKSMFRKRKVNKTRMKIEGLHMTTHEETVTATIKEEGREDHNGEDRVDTEKSIMKESKQVQGGLQNMEADIEDYFFLFDKSYLTTTE